MSYTQQQLQQIVNQMATDLTVFNAILNGDALTTVTLSDGITIVPSLANIINSSVASITNTLLTNLRTSLSKATNDLLNNMYPVDIYSLTIQQAQLGQLIQVNLSNIITIQKVEINGLEQDPAGGVYSLTNSIVSIPINSGLQLNDKVNIFYYVSQ